MADSGRIQEIREILLRVLQKNAGKVDSILLSGGLDTSIIADAGAAILGIQKAFTVVCGGGTEPPPDQAYATAIANALGLEHHIIRIPAPLDLVDPSPNCALDFCVRTLSTFDPMELRNAVVIARALQECAKAGGKCVATGDGADELFAGYTFVAGLSPGRLKRWTARTVGHMKFCAVPLAAAIGIERVVQPYLDPDVVQFALTCKKSELVKVVDAETNKLHGKLILREAFPEAKAQWRRKDPIEVGSGTTVLPKVLQDSYPSDKLEEEKKSIWETDRIRIRDAEHLHYYKVFRRAFYVEGSDDQGRWSCPVERYGSDPCRSCGFQLQRPEQYFCVVCGEWPAREGGLPADTQEGDDDDE
ncbi:hypothetical protein HK104_001340 [Borealophlyctis nickersoniae]|nr:hypothetical protein HK104_001340 [Borealophlyctis nickersoniae]